MRPIVRLASVLLIVVSTSTGAGSAPNRVQEATDLILKLCIAGGSDIEVTSEGGAVQVSGGAASVTIRKNESTGLVGGLSRSITDVNAQQTSEARRCTQRYLTKLLDVILAEREDPSPSAEPPKIGTIHIVTPPGPPCGLNVQITVGDHVIVPYSNDWVVPNVRLGPTTWVVRGRAQCGMDYCMSYGAAQSGQIDVQNGGSYIFNWNIVPGTPRGSECQFSLR